MFYAQISDPTSAGEWITYIWLHGKHFKQSISLSNSTPSAFGGLLKQDIQPPQEWKTSVTDNFRSTQRSPPILLSNSNEPLQPQKGLLLKQGCDVNISNNLKKQISWGSGTGHGRVSFCCQISMSTIFSYYFHYSFVFSLPELYSENCWLANWVESCLKRPISLVVLYVVKICCVYKPKPQTQTIPNTPGHLPQCHGNTSNINHFLHHQTPNKHACVYKYHLRIYWKTQESGIHQATWTGKSFFNRKPCEQILPLFQHLNRTHWLHIMWEMVEMGIVMISNGCVSKLARKSMTIP